MSLKTVGRFFLKSPWGSAILILAIALVTYITHAITYVGVDRIKHAAVVVPSPGSRMIDLVDLDDYTVLAAEMISGEPYRDATRQPLFPAFHALVLLTFGEHPTLFYNRLADSVLAALGCVVVFLLGRRMFGHTVGLLAGLTATVHINMIQKSGYIWSEVMAVPLLSLSLFFFVGFADSRRWRHLLLGGFFLGLTTLTRPTTYYLTYLLPVWLWIVYGRINKPMLVRSAAVVGLVLAMLAPWAVHNTMMTGKFMAVSNRPWKVMCGCYGPGQFEQPLGNSRGAWAPIEECGLFTEEEVEQINNMGTWEQEAFFKERFLGYFPKVLHRVPELMVYRTLVFLTLYKSPDRSGVFYIAYHIQQIGLFAFFIGGLWITRRQWRRLSAVYLAYFLLGIFTTLVVFSHQRYRLNVEPIIIVFASAYAVHLVEKYILKKRPAPAPAQA